LAEELKRRLDELDFCAVLNRDTPGMSVCWWVLPKGRDAKRIIADLEAGKLSPEEVARYTAEVRRLFNKRAYSMDPTLDARLSFTTDIGYRPHGQLIPAWKAVFFHPKTDEVILDRLMYSIDEMT